MKKIVVLAALLVVPVEKKSNITEAFSAKGRQPGHHLG
jgi:hypothetical protein